MSDKNGTDITVGCLVRYNGSTYLVMQTPDDNLYPGNEYRILKVRLDDKQLIAEDEYLSLAGDSGAEIEVLDAANPVVAEFFQRHADLTQELADHWAEVAKRIFQNEKDGRYR